MVITEGLGILDLITRPVLASSWITISIAGAAVALVQRRNSVPMERTAKRNLTSAQWFQVFAMVALLLAILMTAIVSPPNSSDSMMYHLPRVVEWANNKNVNFYPTPYYPQLTMPPMAEYVLLHLRVLSGSDATANLVQWGAFIGCIVGVSYVAFLLGARRSTQIFAAACCASIPTCVLAASGTKNDLVLSYFLVCSLALVLYWERQGDSLTSVALGLAASLAIFCKGTGFIYMPCLVFPVFLSFRRETRRRFCLLAPIFLVAVIVINGPLWTRNHELTGSPLGFSSPLGEKDLDLEGHHNFRPRHVTVTGVLSNIVRNSVLDLGTPIDRLNEITVNVASHLIRAMGNEPNNQDWIESVLFNGFNFGPISVSTEELSSGNLMHFVLYLTLLIVIAIRWRHFPSLLRILATGLVTAFVGYSALLRWTPYSARYQMPIFVCGTALAAVVLSKLCEHGNGPQTGLALVLLLGAFPFELANKARPIIPFAFHKQIGAMFPEQSIFRLSRDVLYFGDGYMPSAESEIAAAQSVRSGNCQRIGIDTTDYFDYPMMAMLLEDGIGREIRYVGVDNRSVRYARSSDPPPCAIVCIRCTSNPVKMARYSAFNLRQAFGQTLVLTNTSVSGQP